MSARSTRRSATRTSDDAAPPGCSSLQFEAYSRGLLSRFEPEAPRFHYAGEGSTGASYHLDWREAERLEQDALQRARVEEMSEKDISKEIKRLEKLMMQHARDLEFEQAARVRDELALLKQRAFGASGGDPVSD